MDEKYRNVEPGRDDGGYKVKGITILGLVKLLKKRTDQEDMQRVLDDLGETDRQVLDERILVSSWYPYRVFHNLLESMDRVLGNGDGKMAYEIGRLAAERDLTTIYRSILSFLSTGFITKKALAAWRNYYSSGGLELVQDETEKTETGTKRIMSFKLSDFRTMSQVHCMNILGWCEKFVELLGATDIEVEETSCIHKGGDYCEFRLSWKDGA